MKWLSVFIKKHENDTCGTMNLPHVKPNNGVGDIWTHLISKIFTTFVKLICHSKAKRQ